MNHTQSLLRMSATQMGKKLRDGSLSSQTLVNAHIERIQEVNPLINAVIEDRFDEARKEAKRADEMLQTEDPHSLPPFHGIPCTIKEFLSVKGMSHTGGITSRKGICATRNGTVVQRLRDAGAIILGITNGPEGGLWHETHNRIFGRTNNPWDLGRTSGGSSGGEGAIIGAGGSPIGLGSDVGGSIRLPAAFCGIVGHKPTGGLLPTTGHFPASPHPTLPYLTVGPMTRYVEDLMPMLQVMVGPDGEDTTCQSMPLGNPESVDLASLKIYPVPSIPRTKIDIEIQDAVTSSTDALVDRGATCCELDSVLFRDAMNIWAGALTHTGQKYSDIVADGGQISLLRELLDFPLGRANHTGPVLMMLTLEHLLRGVPKHLGSLKEKGETLQAHLEDLLGDTGVMIFPSFGCVAPHHHTIALRPMAVGCTGLFNILEFPVTQTPIGYNADGMPMGVQVVGARGMDHLTIAVASALEARFQGFRPAQPSKRSAPIMSLLGL